MLAPEFRVRNFHEIATGFKSLEDAQEEARRCLRCPKRPCNIGCPVGNDIPEFIAKIEEGDLEGAKAVLEAKTSLPGVCARVCPQEKQCEGVCTRGKAGEPVNIGALERFIADQRIDTDTSIGGQLSVHLSPASTESTSLHDVSDTHNLDLTDYKPENAPQKRVVCVGSGPASLACADILSSAGVKVDVLESRDYLGGVLAYGIPIFRLPRHILRGKIKRLRRQGVDFQTGTKVGESILLDELVKGYDAIFLGHGADIPRSAGIDGTEAKGVIQALDFLESAAKRSEENPDKPLSDFAGKDVLVVGGGNVAMDVACTASRCSAKSVTVTYRRSLEELPARPEEVRFNEEEGVKFQLLSYPVGILTDESGKVRALRAQKVVLGEPDESGRRTPTPQPGSDFEIPADIIILAIGSSNDDSVLQGAQELEADQTVNVDSSKRILVDDSGHTSHPKIWAGGDAVSGPLTVVSAQNAGRRSAFNILEHLGVRGDAQSSENGDNSSSNAQSTEDAGVTKSDALASEKAGG
jgi:glutamate synthase (NADPH/NADH) small chain